MSIASHSISLVKQPPPGGTSASWAGLGNARFACSARSGAVVFEAGWKGAVGPFVTPEMRCRVRWPCASARAGRLSSRCRWSDQGYYSKLWPGTPNS